ncbi:MAG TPA: LacI family DNA-binding transcriptional regulator [Amycolatopsis sp.]|nr:LacI family DNA-binding transcriptional regulator [Amycolatopsis sp.]
MAARPARPKRTTVSDIARRAGVSESAVSFALNNRPGVSEQTRARILAVADELSWRPNSAARALSAARTGTVGLVFTRPASTLGIEPFFLQLLSGIQGVLSERSTALLFQVVDGIDAEIATYRRWASEQRVDGVLVVDLQVGDPRPAVLAALRLPALLIGGPDPSHDLPAIWADDAGAMTSIVEYLAQLGHRRIVYVSGLRELLHTQHRLRSFRNAVRRLRLTGSRSVATDYSGEAGADATRKLLRSPDRPTAIVYDNDVMAVAAVAVAAELGVAVPREVSMVAWDDSPLCRLTHPTLTALVRDTAGFGAHAARRLLEIVDDGVMADIEDQLPQLQPRGSTGPA